MKTTILIRRATLISSAVLLIAAGCSSMPGQSENSKEIAARGPSVINAHSNPGTIQLNRDLQPVEKAEVLADIKDFTSPVQNVKLQFIHVPLEVPMENIGGTTWRASLTPRQLQMLAVSGKTIEYSANVIAQDKNGQTGMSQSPVQVAIKSPDLSSAATG